MYPEKEVAGDSESTTEATSTNYSLEINTEPLPSEYALNNMKESLTNTEISKSDPCVTGNVSEDLMTETFDRPNVVDGFNTTHEINKSDEPDEVQSSDMAAHENSAFTRVVPSEQLPAESEVEKILKTDDLPLFGAERYIPAPEDGETSEMLNTGLSTEDNTEGFVPEDEMLNNLDTINVPLQDHIHGSVSPVSGNIPPHNTPVIGANKGEVNLQDVRLALTQVFNEEDADYTHDYRRSFSADVYHEKEKDQAMRLRHNSGISMIL